MAMPQTKLQRALFGLMMAFMMVLGMETYNQLLLHGGFTGRMVPVILHELPLMMALVLICEGLVAGRLAHRAACRLSDPRTHRPLRFVLTLSLCTVCLMCPMMSLAATLLFKEPSPAVYARTLAVNFPAALGWQLLVAGPLVRFLFGRFFPVQEA